MRPNGVHIERFLFPAAAILSVCWAASDAVAQVRSTSFSGDPEACPPTATGPVSVTIQQDLGAGDAAEVVNVSERVTGAGVEASTIDAPGAGRVDDIVVVEGLTPVGDFHDWAPVGGADPGCIGQKGEWFASFDDAADTYTLGSMGGDIWQQGDSFAFPYLKVSGDFTMTVRIADLNPRPDTGWAKTGIMARQDLDRRSRYVFILSAFHGENAPTRDPGLPTSTTALSFRSQHLSGNDNDSSRQEVFYRWLQLLRSGSDMFGRASNDGTNWQDIGSTTWTGPDEVLLGLAVSSGDPGWWLDCDDPPVTASYENVVLELGVGAAIVPLPPPPGGGKPQVVGANISWQATRGDVAQGLDYQVNTGVGGLFFSGSVDGNTITGDTRVSAGATNWGPFPGFGTGLTNAHAIGAECPDTEVTIDGGELTVVGAGADIWDASDHFLFAYTEVAGDFSARVRIASRGTPPAQWSKHGIMARRDCSQGSKHTAVLDVDPFSTRLWGRQEDGASSFNTFLESDLEISPHSDNLRLDRRGNVLTGYLLDDGDLGQPGVWIPLGEMDWGPDAPESLLVGVAVSSMGSPETSQNDCDLFDVTFADWQVDPVPPTPTQRTLAGVSDCPPSGRLEVTVQRDLDGENPDEVVAVSEVARGAFGAAQVTATNGTAVESLELGVTDVGILGAAVPIGASDPGCVGTRGEWSATFDGATGSYTVASQGGNIWRDGDDFTFAFSRIAGDFTLTARVATTNPHPISAWGKAGIMARQDLDWRSRYSFVDNPVWGEEATPDAPWTTYTFRATHLGSDDNDGQIATNSTYEWLRLERLGDTLTGFGSDDGVAWTMVGTDTWSDPPDEMLVGLTISSGDPQGVSGCDNDPSEATYDSVELVLGDGAETLPVELEATGVEISWNVTGAELAGGVGYSVDIDDGTVSLQGTASGQRISGPSSATVANVEEVFGPFPDFGTGLTQAHAIGTECEETNVFAVDQTLAIVGAGSGFGGAADGFEFAYTEMSGDFSVQVTIAREGVDFVPPINGTPTFGIVARQECSVDSLYTGVLNQTGGNTAFSGRRNKGGISTGATFSESTGFQFDTLRLDREGNALIGYVLDAVGDLGPAGEWAEIGREAWGAGAPDTLLLGLAVASGATACASYDVDFTGWQVGTGGAPVFRRGDANADGATNLADAVATFNFLFTGGDTPTCLDAADTNDADDALNLTDGVYLLNFLFLGGGAPPLPGPFDCGPEPAGSTITFGCDRYVACDVGG